MNSSLNNGAPRGRHPVADIFMRAALLSALVCCASAHAQTEPYSYYGGEIDAEEKNAAIEACEYRVLVEERRCNRRANKSACIEEVHLECREAHGDDTTEETPESN